MSEERKRRGGAGPVVPRISLDKAQLERLVRALEHLRPRDREIYFAVCRDRRPYAEIARQHHMKAAKVEQLLARTLVKLHAAVYREDAS